MEMSLNLGKECEFKVCGVKAMELFLQPIHTIVFADTTLKTKQTITCKFSSS